MEFLLLLPLAGSEAGTERDAGLGKSQRVPGEKKAACLRLYLLAGRTVFFFARPKEEEDEEEDFHRGRQRERSQP